MEQGSSSDSFAQESGGGTARFLGSTADVVNAFGMDNANVTSMPGGTYSAGNGGGSAGHEFQTMKPSGVLPKMYAGAHADIPHNELVKMLYYLEGELQARDVVIAALRNERVKQLITQLRVKRVQPNDPYAAIFRDKIALNGNLISREASQQAAQAELEVRQIIEQQMEQQHQMVSKQRATHVRMVKILTDSLENNQRMLQELEEEKRKHEHDTAQGDDITYGLEMERTKLRQELEEERAQLKKMEAELKRLKETLESERNREKQIVLLLIAERKKILMKYIEEGKRSEDLAQILAEEKQRSDNIAEGLEEESKKSLRMEEELEKQTVVMHSERKSLLANLAKEEQRVKELEQEVIALRSENDALRKQQLHLQSAVSSSASGSAIQKPRNFSEEACPTPLVNIAKIVQPTATVSSVPVSGPTTGIARSIAPGQRVGPAMATPVLPTTQPPPPPPLIGSNLSSQLNCDTVISNVLAAANAPSSPSPAKMQPTATIQRAPGGKYAALAAAAAAAATEQTVGHVHPHPVPIAVPPVTVPPPGARGAPPPIPTKPIVPPKREPSLSRLGSISGPVNAVNPNVSAAVPSVNNVTAGTNSSKLN